MIKRIVNYYRRKFWNHERYARYIGVTIGNNCMISTKSFSSEPFLIKIGDNVRIANNVKFFTHGGLIPFRKRMNANLDMFGKINIGNNVHIGDSSLILPGITIGDDSIVGAGSVVSKSFPSNSIVAGNPAKVVGSTDEFLKRAINKDVGSKGMNYHEKRTYLLSLSDDKFIKK